MTTTTKNKTSKAQQKNLARSMSLEAWQDLCGYIVFLDALETDIAVAQMIAEDYHLNGGRACQSLTPVRS